MNHNDPFWTPDEFRKAKWETPVADFHRLTDNHASPPTPILVAGCEVVTLDQARHLERSLRALHAFYRSEFAKMREERDRLREEVKAMRIAQAVEGMDPNGTIWEHADKLQKEYEELQRRLKELAI